MRRGRGGCKGRECWYRRWVRNWSLVVCPSRAVYVPLPVGVHQRPLVAPGIATPALSTRLSWITRYEGRRCTLEYRVSQWSVTAVVACSPNPPKKKRFVTGSWKQGKERTYIWDIQNQVGRRVPVRPREVGDQRLQELWAVDRSAEP